MAAEAPQSRGSLPHQPTPDMGRTTPPNGHNGPDVTPLEQDNAMFVNRALRTEAFQRLSGVDAKGRRRELQVVRDKVDELLTHPEMVRGLLKKHVFAELSGPKIGVEQVFAEQATRQMSQAELAQELRPRVKAIYANLGGEGIKEFEALTDEQIIADAQDFSGTVARELFLRDYLDRRVANEEELDNRLRDLAGIGIFDFSLSRPGFTHTTCQKGRARAREWWELDRVADKRLQFSKQERMNLLASFKALNEPAPDEYQADKSALQQQARLLLEKTMVRNITGDKDDPALDLVNGNAAVDGTRHDAVLEAVRKREVMINDAVALRAELLMKRTLLYEVASRTMNASDVAAIINEVRVLELRYRGMKRAIGAMERSEQRRLKLAAIRAGGGVAAMVPATANRVSQFYGFVERGFERIENQTVHRAYRQIDRILSFARMRGEDSRFIKGLVPTADMRQERSIERHKYTTASVAEIDRATMERISSDPELARQYEELSVQQRASGEQSEVVVRPAEKQPAEVVATPAPASADQRVEAVVSDAPSGEPEAEESAEFKRMRDVRAHYDFMKAIDLSIGILEEQAAQTGDRSRVELAKRFLEQLRTDEQLAIVGQEGLKKAIKLAVANRQGNEHLTPEQMEDMADLLEQRGQDKSRSRTERENYTEAAVAMAWAAQKLEE